jgi:hypothetical protein
MGVPIRSTARVLGWVVVALVAVGLLTVVVLAFGPLPERVLAHTIGLSAADRVKAEADVRASVLQAVAGTLLVVGAVTAWRQMLIARGQHRLSRRTAITEAFAKAVEHLGDAGSSAIRLGGIYSLDRVAEDDPAEGRRVGEILSAFVRERAVATPPDREVVAAVSVLVRRDWSGPIDLSGAALGALDLAGSSLAGAVLRATDLRGAQLRHARLRGADLRHADLRGADLQAADLREACLDGAKLSGATGSATRWPDGFVPADHGVRTG